ncbi:MAG: hypothetical protein LPK85_05515 [Gammaproteobacteria bacterium]|nr:hypothetical protein [Gammaproteobacteria bacterium]
MAAHQAGERVIFAAPTPSELQVLMKPHRNSLKEAATTFFEVMEAFGRLGEHPVTATIRDGPQPFTQFTHYPQDDVDDIQTGYAWYYHAHAPSRERPWSEHGHFHCYAYTENVPADVKPVALPRHPDPVAGGLIHLIALCMNEAGVPYRLFTLNRWASDEWLFPAQTVVNLAKAFHLENPRHQLTSRWLGVMLRLLQPQIEWLVAARDRRIFPNYPDLSPNFSESPELEITSTLTFDLDEHLAAVERL